MTASPDTLTASDVFATLGIASSKTWCNTEARIERNGREYLLIVTSSRATLHACNSAPGASDGFEVARTYAAPAYSIPLMLGKLAA